MDSLLAPSIEVNGGRHSLDAVVRRLRDHEKEVLEDLRAWPYQDGWARPMDVGGTDASHHGRTLAKLVKLGLAEKRRRHVGISSGSNLYRAKPPNSGDKRPLP